MSAPRVGLLEGRMSGELASLVRRHGGDPVLGPALREETVQADAPVGALVDALAAGEIQVVLFLTGVGANALFNAAEGIGRLEELIGLLQSTTNVSRGQKPWTPLKRRGVPITVTVPDPYTTTDVVRTLSTLDLAGRGVALVHYGERNEVLADALAGWGASVRELCLYEWRLPEDTGPLRSLIGEIVARGVDAVALTSQVQLRHLLQVAREMGQEEALLEALRGDVLVAAVGPTCAAALEGAGITPDVVPAHPKMGPMVVALMERLRSGTEGDPDPARVA
jgi:uroporphyrinogen-III synthase